MSKTARRAAVKRLPALRASLRWYKREVLRRLRRIANGSTLGARMYEGKIARVRASAPADLYDWYISERVTEIRRAPLAELRTVVPALVVVRA